MDPFRDNTGYGRYGEGGAEVESVHSLGTDAMRPEMTQLREHAAPMGYGDSPRVESSVLGLTATDGSGIRAGAYDAVATRGASPPAPQQPKPPFWKKKKFIIAQCVLIPLAIIILFVLLFPVIHAIAQHVIDVSVLNVDTAAIINPQNTTFTLALTGVVTHTGIFSAKIMFTENITVSWLNGTDEVPLGYMSLDTLSAKSKRAYINQTTTFIIQEQENFGAFTAAMITQQNFTWRLSSDNLKVQADKFPVATHLKFRKDTVINGINNFNGMAKLVDFQLPHDDPAGGITFSATTELLNESPFNVDLGTVQFGLYYQGIFLGNGTGTDVTIVPSYTNVTLNGRLVSHADNATELTAIGQLFSSYLNAQPVPVIAKGISTQQPDGTFISWLTQGIQSLELTVPFTPPNPINSISAIDVVYLNLSFTPETAWDPATSSNEITAQMKIPFGFNISIGDIQNEFSIVQNGVTVGSLSTPVGSATSDIKVLGPQDTEGQVNITIANTNLQVPDSAHDLFSQFNHDLTVESGANFNLVGHARAIANMSIGQIVLDPINFNVTNGLIGLDGLNAQPTVIKSVDVMGGTADHIDLAIEVTIFNPSNLNLNTGDLLMELFSNGTAIGTTLLPNLSLAIGSNTLHAIGQFTPNTSPEGQETLNRFVGQLATPITISGFSGSTNVTSLLQAFEALQISTTLPGLNSSLLGSSSLTVLPSTGIANNMSVVTVSVVNPFTSSLLISNIQSTVTSNGINLGTINQATSFEAKGKSTTTSPSLNLDMNLNPPDIFTLLHTLAISAGMSTAQIDSIVQLGGYSYVPTTANRRRSVSARASEVEDDGEWIHIPFTSHSLLKEQVSAPVVIAKRDLFTGFDLASFVDAAFKKLTTDVTLQSTVSIGNYQTTLSYTQRNVPVSTDNSLNHLLPILASPIVQSLVDGSVLGIDTIVITDPTATTFGTKLTGSITNAGPFDAVITFNSGLTITWDGSVLGTLAMPKVNLVGDVGATIDVTGIFQIADVASLTSFTKAMLTEESFTWIITGSNLTVSALGVDTSGVTMSKTVTLKGMNGLQGAVIINSFDLPANDPAGGVHLTLDTTITNPSQVGISVSSLGFQNYYGATYIGPAAATPGILLPSGASSLPLAGRLVPQSSSSGLADVSTIFTNFIHGIPSTLSVSGDTAGPASATWLNDAIKVLKINVVLPAPHNLQVINSITLNQLTLMFTPDSAYAPLASTADAIAGFQLPFAFPLDIVALSQTIDVSYKGTDMARLQVPKGPSQTDVASRIIHLEFSMVPFDVLSGQDSLFQQFLADTTFATTETFHLSGTANTDAQTAIGLLSISDIAFSVDTSLAGLQGLATRPAIVSNLDVAHGYPSYLLITVNTGLFNPSNITIVTGDVSFLLQFEDETVGTADISDATIVPGEATYATDVHFAPQGGAVVAGLTVLENFLQGINTSTTISGSSDTTDVDSLRPALSEIKLTAVIPALNQNLITSTSLEFPLDIVQTGVAAATFVLSNPFTASIDLFTVFANATYNGVFLGTINFDESSSPIHAAGHSKITSPTLPLKFNLNPLSIVELLSIAATTNNVDIGPLATLFQIVVNNPNFESPIVSSVDTSAPTCVSGQEFDIAGAILKALAGLEVDLAIQSNVKLDDFAVPLSFAQHNVPAVTDQTALFLIGAVAAPIVQTLVEVAELTFTEANITDISETGCTLSLAGSLLGTGPLDAEIAFMEPVVVNWQGNNIATITLPPVCAAANAGVPDYRTEAQLSITDMDAFTNFGIFLLHNPSFEWVISTDKLRVTALGTIFDNVSLNKTLSFKAFDNLPGVTISNFQLPADDPAGGITVSTDSLIPSASNVGIDMGTVVFQSYFDGVLVGPLSGTDVFIAPLGVTAQHLSGRIVPQSGDALNTMGTLFSSFLAGKNQTLQVKGDSVSPGGTQVSWLSTAFQTLTLDVTLPGQIYQIIDSIQMSDLEVTMVEASEAFSPLASSTHTLAKYKNPFGFTLQAIQSAQDITIVVQGVDTASLKLPLTDVDAGVSTGNDADLVLSFNNQVLQSLNDQVFALFFAGVTDLPEASFELKGTADVVANTPIGSVPISGIPFNVTSTLAGIGSFGGTALLSDVTIAGSGDGGAYISAPCITTLDNPSNVTLHTNDLALPVYFSDVMIGRAVINPFDLLPGTISVPTEFRYMPADPNNTIAQSFLTAYVASSGGIPLTIKGDPESSPYASLIPALEGAVLSASVPGINTAVVTQINALLTLDSLTTNLISINFDVFNPLDTELTIEFVQNESGVNGIIYAQWQNAFDNFVVPPKSTVNSGTVNNVLLTQGAFAALDIIPLLYLDIFVAQTVKIADYEVPWLQLQQNMVPTSYTLDLSGDIIAGPKALASAMKALSKSSVSASQTSSAVSTATTITTHESTKPTSSSAPSPTVHENTNRIVPPTGTSHSTSSSP